MLRFQSCTILLVLRVDRWVPGMWIVPIEDAQSVEASTLNTLDEVASKQRVADTVHLVDHNSV